MTNLEKLTTVTKNYTKGGQVSDIRFSQSQEKFFVNEDLFRKLDLNNNGFTLHYDGENKDLFISIRPNQESVMFKGRPDFDNKNRDFSSSEFQKYLETFGWMPEDEEEDLELNLEEAGELEGVQYYKLVRADQTVDESETDVETQADTDAAPAGAMEEQEDEEDSPAFT